MAIFLYVAHWQDRPLVEVWPGPFDHEQANHSSDADEPIRQFHHDLIHARPGNQIRL
jgi:hypothetical protein